MEAALRELHARVLARIAEARPVPRDPPREHPAGQLSERRNATVHAFSSLSIWPTTDGYVAYWAIYVRPVHRVTGLYMRVIAPFRRLVVYPAIIRKVERAWTERYGAENG